MTHSPKFELVGDVVIADEEVVRTHQTRETTVMAIHGGHMRTKDLKVRRRGVGGGGSYFYYGGGGGGS